MSFIAPLLGRVAGAAVGGEAAEAAAGRGSAFTQGMQGVSQSGVLGFDHNLPVVGPRKAEIADVDGAAKRTPNPNTILR